MIAADAQWFRRFRPEHADARIRLICFPHAGGAASTFAPWATPLTSMIDLVAVRYPAREDRLGDAPAESLHDLARAIADAVRAAHEARPMPLAFFGHSMGASVAYETALLLEGEECDPDLVVVSAREAPRRIEFPGKTLGDAELERLIISLDSRNRDVLEHPELRDLVWPSIRGDFEATSAYRPTDSMLRCALVALGGVSDTRVVVDDISAWRESTTGEFRVRLYDGGHFYFADETETFLSELRDTLFGAVAMRSASPQLSLVL